jgi:Xaa-Pro aminopeptidase
LGRRGDHEQHDLPLGDLESWLAQRNGRPTGCLGSPVSGVTSDESLEQELRRVLNRIRRQKDVLELGRMRRAEAATSAGFSAVVPLLAPGRTEREIQIAMESEFFRNGATFLAFDTIVGGGPNSAVLHFSPSPRPFAEGELVLIDAGAEYLGYASDISRTYPVSGRLTPKQAELHTLVRAAGLAAIDCCAPGAEFRDVHRRAALVIAEGLVELGLLRGQPETLVERGSVELFFPHGIGHMVGLGIRDAGEVLDDRAVRSQGFVRLRVDLALLPGHVITIEPGIYFVPALLHDRELREKHRDAVDWALAEDMLGFGGIRIEDNVLITEEGVEVLTADVPGGMEWESWLRRAQ